MEGIGPYKPTKKERRRVIRLSLAFVAFWVSYILWTGGNDQTHIAGLYSLCSFAALIVMFYINGSTKDAASYNDTLVKLKNGGL